MGTRNLFGCGQAQANVRSHDQGSGQAQESGTSFDAPKRNNFYALHSRGEQEESLDVVTGMLQLFSGYVYDLLDPDATLSFVTPLVSKNFNVLPIF